MEHDKGRFLFLKALELRFQGRFEEAGQTFHKAAEAGSGRACWHLWQQYEYGGACQPKDVPDDFDHALLLSQGAKLGDIMCVTRLHVEDLDHFQTARTAEDWKSTFPIYPDLYAEIEVCHAWSEDVPLRKFSQHEMEALQRDVWHAISIHDADIITHYFNYLVSFPKLFPCQDPVMFGHALFLYNDDYAYPVAFKKGNFFHKFTLEDVVKENHFGISIEALCVIKCVIGQLIRRHDHSQQRVGFEYGSAFTECIAVYETYKKPARQAALAFMGCFRRHKLAYFNRDMARKVAWMILDPAPWAELDTTERSQTKNPKGE